LTRGSKDHLFSPGVVLGERYEILSKIGEGGFGEVYKARQLATGQLVALKKRLPVASEGLPLASEGAPRADSRAARFLREARLCALLHHPNIVQLMDAGTAEDGQYFTVFAFVPGENLAELLATEGPLVPQEARHLMLQVLDALACAHTQGVVHRDLKPSNIMVVQTGARRNAVVLDFGIGALTLDEPGASSARLTGSRDVLGTPGYGAPEQCLGGEISPSADLFSWGLVFIECLTGRPALAGASQAEVIYRLLGPEPVPIPEALAGHPLGALLRRVTSKDAATRVLSAHELLHALEACDLTYLARATLDHHSPSNLDVPCTLEQESQTQPFSGGASVTIGSSASSIKERRHPTAVCCRIVPRSRKTSAIDIEEADELLRATLSRCADVIHKHAGHVAAALGDLLLAYFGFPRADEDAARRAGRAALAITEVIRTENERLSAQGAYVDVGIGVHSGLLVATEAESDPRGHSAVGETPRLAATLATAATPNAVLVTAEMERLLRVDFDLESIAPHSGEAIAEKLQIFRLERQKRSAPTSATGNTGEQSRLIGRAHELEMLIERWRRAGSGAGQCGLLTGEPGIGKTRLSQELHNRIGSEEHTYLEGRCHPDAQNEVLFPFVQMIENALGIDRHETLTGNIARLETELTSYGLDLPETVPLVLDLCSLPIRPPYVAREVSPQRHMEQLQSSMLCLFFRMAETRPLLMVVEDLQWASPTALGFLTRLIREAPGYPICVIMTARTEFSPSFPTLDVLQLPLSRLDADETRALATEFAGGSPLSHGLLDVIISRTDGIPLFVEEMTRLLLETGMLAEARGRVDAWGAQLDALMPCTLRALISARLDRLEGAKATAAVAAALGRDFSVEVLTAVSPLGPEAVRQHLETLTNAGLIVRRGRRRAPVATFKHALVRDAAYDSLPRAEKQRVHARIGETLEERFPDIPLTRPEVLAHHFAAADRVGEAIPYAQKAAEQALHRCAYGEAIAIASKVLSWAPALQSGDAVSARLAANGVLTLALMTSRGWADPEIKQIANESSALLQQLPSSNPNKWPMLWSLFVYFHTASDRSAARLVAEEIVAAGDALGDSGPRAVAAVVLGATLHAEGDMRGAGKALKNAISLYDARRHRDHGFRFGIDTLVWAKALLAHIRWFENQDARAFQLVDESMSWARELAHVPTIALGLMYGAQVYQHAGNKTAVAAMTEEILALAQKYGLPAYEGYASILHGWATKNEEQIRPIVETLEAMGCNLGLSYFSSLPADILADRGALDAAIAVVDRCLCMCEKNDEHHYEHFLHWRRAMYFKRKGSADGEVQTSLDRARNVARRCGASRVEDLALGHHEPT
jgi:TOMM system kinase/cyclase fusion protein